MQTPFMPIQPLNAGIAPMVSQPVGIAKLGGSEEGSGGDFQGMFMTALNGVNGSLQTAGQMGENMMTGKLQNLHDMTIAGAKAEVMLHLTTQIASKMSTACTTLFQMQL